MADSFSDLWASAAPSNSNKQQLPLKSLAAAANSNNNTARRTTPDAFSMLASAGSSQPSSRPITPRPAPPKPASASAGDAFGGLVSFGGTNARDDGLTIAERAAKAERARNEQAEREQTALKSQGEFWDQFDKPIATKASNGAWDADSLTATKTKSNGNASKPTPKADWDLDFISSTPEVDVTPPTVQPSKDIFDIDDFATFGTVSQPRSVKKELSRSNTPGSFDFGDRENLGADGDDDDDILGVLAKPVEEARRASPRPVPTRSPKPKSPSQGTHSRTSSPPPHVLGRIVEMGFSVQQAKVALAATDSGMDVDAALEILLRDAPPETQPERDRDEEEAEAEAERKRRRRQGPSRATVSSSPGPSATPQQQQPQFQADKLLAQASTIGLSMFSKANAIWKEGREKVVKVYEERAGSAADVGKGTGRPRWMDDAPGGGTREEEGEAVSSRARAAPIASKPKPQPTQSQEREHSSLFADNEPTYKSPARRRPPATRTPSASLPSSRPTSKPPTPPRAPSPVSRPSIPLAPSALASSTAHKSTGTQHFKLGRFSDADTAYTAALAPLPPLHLLRVPLLNNRALVRLRTGDHKGAVADAGEVVEIVTGGLGEGWSPAREAVVVGEGGGEELGQALGKALRRRAEAQEGMEKWEGARGDWERLSRAQWVGTGARGEAVRGAGRCRRMLAPAHAPASKLAGRRPPPEPVTARPSEALARVRDANKAQEVEDQERHDLKDSVDARLEAWRAGKETNLRALIASLDTVLWPELGWVKVGMAELVSPGQVKVRYTRAISKVHPDKLNGGNTSLQQRMIANGVFGTLNEAWNAFR